MKLYPASKVKAHIRHWKALRPALAELGVDLNARWIDWDYNGDSASAAASAWADHWANIVEDVRAADVCLFLCEESERACSALIELGIALGNGKQVFIVSDYWWSVSHHKNCRTFPTLEAAVAAIVAQARGERLRLAKK